MKVYLDDGSPVFFLCDRKACGEKCPSEFCTHTSDIEHAKNFDSVRVNADNLTDYFECEEKKGNEDERQN